MPPQFILVGIGSRGDVDPLTLIAAALQERGNDVLMVALPEFAEEARNLGLPTIEAPGSLAFALTPPPRRGGRLVRRLSRSLDDWRRMRDLFDARTRWMFDLVRDRHRPGDTVLVARSGLFGARVAREVLDLRLATVHHSPASLRSRTDSLRFSAPAGRDPLRRGAQELLWRVADGYVGRLLLPSLNGFRRDLGLPPARRLFDRWAYSPDLNLGLFPSWYAPPQADWPETTRLAGFPLPPRRPSEALPREVQGFLADGEPPVVVSYGAHEDHGGQLERAVRRLAGTGAARAIFLGRCDRGVATENLLFCRFAPLLPLLPHARALVHHGGVGTMAAALAAGTPQLVVPVIGDQWDQARRATRHGVAGVLRRSEIAAKLEGCLSWLLHDPAVSAAARAARGRAGGDDGVARAADWLEALSRRQAPLPAAIA